LLLLFVAVVVVLILPSHCRRRLIPANKLHHGLRGVAALVVGAVVTIAVTPGSFVAAIPVFAAFHDPAAAGSHS
jgi:hypothetical protein